MAAFVEWHPSQLVMARRQLPETYRGWLAAAAGIVALAGAIAWSVAQPSETSSPATAPGQTTEKVTESLDGFVALPAAFGLPQFESGRIIRVDIPVASLPAYGVAVIPDTDQREVAADVLIGQDDQPRAIRLVSSEHQ